MTPVRNISPTDRPGRRSRSSVVSTTLLAGLVTAAMSIGAVQPTFAATPPDYLNDPTSAPGTFTSVNLAADRTAENFFYRIPAIAHLGDGVVVASWDARPGSAADAPNPNSIIQRRSTDNGLTWGPLKIIAAGHVGDADAPRYGYSDPSYVFDQETGRLFSFFVYSKDQGFHGSTYGNDDANRQVISSAVIHSDDGGVTWSEPRLITDVTKPATGTTSGGTYTPVAGDVRANFATSGAGIQLKYGPHAGRLIQQYAGTVRQADGSTQIQAYSVYSDDHGDSWQRGEFVGTGMDENKVVELSDGRVMLNSRDSSNGHARKVAISTDGGATYGPVTRDLELPDPTNNASIIRLHPDAAAGSADARKLLFTNSNNGANGSRVNGAVRLSCDDGETWPGLRTIEPGFFAYSQAAMLDGGRIGVLWERSYTDNVQFSTFDQAWINATCAPLSVPETDLEPGVATEVTVTVTNQETTALSGEVSFHTPAGWASSSASVADLAPGASTTVAVAVTAPAGAAGTQRLQAAFTAADGRLSQTTATLRLPQATQLGLTLGSTITTAARDAIANPFVAGDVLSFQVRVDSTSTMATLVTPDASNFTSGFAPTACRWRNLPAMDGYNCNTPRHTLTAEDIGRGWFAPEFSFTVAPMTDTANTVLVEHTGAAVLLRDGVLGATITGARTDEGRDLASSPYAIGEQVPYAFRVDSTSPVTAAVVPTAGDFAPFIPPGPGNCRYLSLPAFGSYDCTTPKHTVTQADRDRGYFVADTIWTVSAAGQTTKTIEVDGGEVDVLARNPQLSGQTSGEFTDVNGNGVANVGDTVTWTSTLTNAGNVVLDDVTVGYDEIGSLTVGETRTAGSETVVLTAEHVAAGSLTPASFDATAANGSRTVETVAAGVALELQRAPLWDAVSVYTSGDLVTFEGRLFEATWWTKNTTPGDPKGPWQEITTNADGVDLWTASRVFLGGDVVSHDGEQFVAERWTRNQEPGSNLKRDPWTPAP
ncbi:hypothetical protein GCM10009749_14370 [Agromyces neolithicus]|uniref:exo-alpha-sialidase n=1 Tax=Agromyces neolithicus TaxID=269420 RepID=A0ABN2M2Q5_9MICO